jgi:hypothetical protein
MKKIRAIAAIVKKPIDAARYATKIPSSSKMIIELMPLILIYTDSSEGIEKIKG